MSERILALLLRLYPARFRADYGGEALQLFRDRVRDEKGIIVKLRLAFDLLFDLILCNIRGYHPRPLQAARTSVHRHVIGIPSFYVFEETRIHRGALLMGVLLTCVILVSSSVILSSGAAGGSQLRISRPSLQFFGISILQSFKRSNPNADEWRRVVNAVSSNLKQYYIDQALAQEMAHALQTHEQNGDYNAVRNGAAFADLLSKQLRDISHDMRLDVVFSPAPLPQPGPPPEAQQKYRSMMDQLHCTFEKVEILPRNIGYVKLNAFPQTDVCRLAATAVLASVNDADSIIFDLRDNGGGSGDMVMLIAAYLFDHPEYMYNPRDNVSERNWTSSPVPGNKLADKPAYILTSRRTISAAEHFTYDLKMLKRATVVGETTAGAAHSGVFHRIDDHFGIGIPETKPLNPFSKIDWDVVGIEPDVKAPAGAALEVAKSLANDRRMR